MLSLVEPVTVFVAIRLNLNYQPTFMKKSLVLLVSLFCAAGLASAADNVSYTATSSPANNPDGVDQSLNPVDVWQETIIPGDSGGAGSYQYNGGWAGWYIYSYPDASGGTIQETHTFTGGALAIGQTVSLNWGNSAIESGQQVGFNLLDGSANSDITFSFTGGDPTGHYRYTDSGVSGQDTGFGFLYQTMFNVAFTVTGANTYSATAGTASWTGTFTGSLAGIEVFNNAAGNGSDVGFNNLTISSVPEPSAIALIMLTGIGLFGYQHRKK
jgi:hypothetical protein